MFRFDFDLDDADDDDDEQTHRTSLKPTAEHPGAADQKKVELAPFREIPLDQLVRFRFPYSSASMHFEDRLHVVDWFTAFDILFSFANPPLVWSHTNAGTPRSVRCAISNDCIRWNTYGRRHREHRILRKLIRNSVFRYAVRSGPRNL